MAEQLKRQAVNTISTPNTWSKPGGYKGPLHIIEQLKDPKFTYGWVDKNPERVRAAIFAGWEIDKEILKKLTIDYNMPTISHGTPIEGGLVVGHSILMRKPLERYKEDYLEEQKAVVEPAKAAKKKLAAIIGEDIIHGDVTSNAVE